jgi:pimeloyl-ACP methyl ester carboxylesterase
MEGIMQVVHDQEEKNAPTRQYIVETSHGSLAVEESGQGEIPLLMIHGNSFCRGAFRHQLHSSLTASHRLIAFDLPGNGESSDAYDPERTYTISGLADAVVELLGKMGITDVIVLGWSLGGILGMEMIQRFPGLRGLMTTGAPAVDREHMAQAFNPTRQRGLVSKQDWSPAEADAFVELSVGKSAEPFMRDAVVRADGRLRRMLFSSVGASLGPAPRQIVENSQTPLAVVNGGADPVVNLDYVDSIQYANLWNKHCCRLEGLGHAPFWEAPEAFNPLVERFLADVESGRASAQSGR